MPFASWRYVSREVHIRTDDSTCAWPLEGFPEGDPDHPGDGSRLQPAPSGFGVAFRRRYSVRVERPVLRAAELMSIVANDPNVACPLEIARFERDEGRSGPIAVGEEMRVRLPGPWNGPVRVVDVEDCSFRLATLQGHLEAGEIRFGARDEADDLVFEIESWARSSDRITDFFYDRLGLARELQLDMWAFFLERVTQVSGGTAAQGIEVHTQRCEDHPY